MEPTLKKYQPRRWVRISLIQSLARICSVLAYLALISCIGIFIFLPISQVPAICTIVSIFLVVCFCTVFAIQFATGYGTRKVFNAQLIDIESERFRKFGVFVRKASRSRGTRIKFYLGSKGVSLSTFSWGLPGLPITLVLTGLKTLKPSYRELLAGIAHEFGHVYNGNMVVLNFIRAVALFWVAVSFCLIQLQPWGTLIPRRFPQLKAAHMLFAYTVGILLIPVSFLSFYVGLTMAYAFFSLPAYIEEYAADTMAYSVQGTATHLRDFLLRYEQLHSSQPEKAQTYSFVALSKPENTFGLINAICKHPATEKRIRLLMWLSQEHDDRS